MFGESRASAPAEKVARDHVRQAHRGSPSGPSPRGPPPDLHLCPPIRVILIEMLALLCDVSKGSSSTGSKTQRQDQGEVSEMPRKQNSVRHSFLSGLCTPNSGCLLTFCALDARLLASWPGRFISSLTVCGRKQGRGRERAPSLKEPDLWRTCHSPHIPMARTGSPPPRLAGKLCVSP